MHGATKASPIAAATRLGRGDVYRALDRLVARGYVITAGTWPLAYSPVDPDEIFARALAENRARRAAIVDASAVLAVWWAQGASLRRSESETFRELTGHATIAAAAKRMISRATRLVRLLDKRPTQGAGTAPLRAETFRRAVPSRVELRVVGEDPTRREGPRVDRERREGSGTASSWLLVVDDAQAMILDESTLAEGDAHTELRATWTESPTLIAMAVALHDSLWARAEAARERDSD